MATVDGEIVTKFLLGTYRLQPTRHDVQAAVQSAVRASQRLPDELEADAISLTSGSSAELYIKPMLSCVDDIDIMFHRSTQLAIPDGSPTPTQLPDEFHGRIKVYEAIDGKYPGFVYLKTRYTLTKSIDGGSYNVELDVNQEYLSQNPPAKAGVVINGPAATRPGNSTTPSYDQVSCLRCLLWPPQATDWPTRHRKYDWPDSATVNRVVSNGCDVVRVAHRLCRYDEFESKCQWRLSFSRAEIVLLNSWVPEQQIVYHMMRTYAKSLGLTKITDNAGQDIINNYHFKTLMLWACEEKPKRYWKEDTNVIKICVKLLRRLAGCLTKARCEHYFIRDCNLMGTVENVKIITKHLIPITESHQLSMWFVNNYIVKCSEMCPDNVSRLFDVVRSEVDLHNAVSAVIAWRRNTALQDLCEVCDFALHTVVSEVPGWSESIHTCVYFMDELAKLNLQLSHYLTAVAFLRFAIKYRNHDVDVKSMNILSALCAQPEGRRRHSSQLSCMMLLSEATKAMKDVANNSRSTVQLIEIDLSKLYLYRALRYNDSDNDSIYCLANVYLAVLYYATGQCQPAIDHCTLVMAVHDHSRCCSHIVLQGQILPKLDNDIDNVLGLAVFYQYVQTAALGHMQQTQHVTVFTTELLAHYLLIRCLLATKRHQLAQTISTSEVQHCYFANISNKQELFIGDVLLFMTFCFLPKSQCHFKGRSHRWTIDPCPSEPTTSKLVELLQQSAVEHLTTFRQFAAREFGSLCTIVTTDFEAMYAYKRGDYQRCLRLSSQNVRTLLNARHWTDVYTFPEFSQLLDDDIFSLAEQALAVNPEYRRKQSEFVAITQLTLSLYLMTQCQLKLRHSAAHVAQTLNYIQVAQNRHTASRVLDHLTLKLSKEKATDYVNGSSTRPRRPRGCCVLF